MPRALAGVVLLLLLLSPAALRAQGDAAVDLDTLRATLERLDRELAFERELGESSAKAQARQLAEAERERDALAERWLLLAEERESLWSEKSDLERELAATGAARDSALREVQELVAAARGLGEHLRVQLGEGEGSQPIAAAVDAGLEALEAEGVDALPGVTTVLGAFERLHHQACNVEVRTGDVWTARGLSEPSEVLSVGDLFFAYRTMRDDRIGLALAAPADASGHRFTEVLEPRLRTALEQAFEHTARGDVPFVPFPIDPSGALRADRATDHPSLLFQLQEGGLVMIPLVVVAVLAFLLLLERFTTLFLRTPLELGTARNVLTLTERGDYESAAAHCRAGRGMVLRTLGACLARRTESSRVLDDLVQAQLLQELPRLRRSLGGIASLAAVAPLLGLLGTVTGIIRTFGAIRAFGNSNPSLMAGGISEALLTTAAGMSIAIPVLLLHVLLRARVDRAVAETERHAALLLTHLSRESGR